MKKILHTFFFGYAPFRYRRLIRTPIVLTVFLLCSVNLYYDIEYSIPDNNKIDLIFNQYIDDPDQPMLNIAYQLFVDDGYNDTFEDFKTLLNTNDNALEDSYSQFVDRYPITFVSYKNMISGNKLTREDFIEFLRPYNTHNQYSISELRIEPITWDYTLRGLSQSLFILFGVVFISFLIEPFTRKKGEVKVVLKDTTESISEDSITKEKPIADALDEVIVNNRIPVSDNLKKVYKTVIRIVMFLVIYLSLFTIIFYTEFLLLTPVIVLVSFFLSKPLTNTLVLKWFPNLEK